MTTTQEIRAKLLDETYEQSVDELKCWLQKSSDHQELVRLVDEVVRVKFILREED
tara:strand:- start:42 stop:206 length:165 start_codon:yes stop_codon:yes gene_type:complete